MALSRSKNITENWAEDETVPLVLDLDAFTLNGTALGQPAEKLSFLGPGVPAKHGHDYNFTQKGVILEIVKNAVTSFHVQAGFPGHINRQGTSKPFTDPDLVASCGDPESVEQFDGEKVLTYAQGDQEWELTLDRAGGVKTISIY